MERVTVSAVGDITPGFEPLESGFAHVMDHLRSADVRFGHSEREFSDRGQLQRIAQTAFQRRPPRLAGAFKTVPFDVVSAASNHIGEHGPEAVEDTVAAFHQLGIQTIGAGLNIEEARKPAIVTSKGVRIAFLGYVSVLPLHFWATESRAGCAPMRAHTYYEPYEFQPGAPPRVVTVPHEEDLENLVRDVRKARENADVVILSLHWGLHYQPRPCDYQPIVAHAAIDAGATAIIGHHPHQPQGVEVYKDGVIFYSVGNFCTYRAAKKNAKAKSMCQPNLEYSHDEVYSIDADPEAFYSYHRHYDEGGIAFMEVDRSGLVRASYLPTLMNAAGQPEVLRPDQPQFEKSLKYLNWAGKFIRGGVTDIKAAGDRYEVYSR